MCADTSIASGAFRIGGCGSLARDPDARRASANSLMMGLRPRSVVPAPLPVPSLPLLSLPLASSPITTQYILWAVYCGKKYWRRRVCTTGPRSRASDPPPPIRNAPDVLSRVRTFVYNVRRVLRPACSGRGRMAGVETNSIVRCHLLCMIQQETSRKFSSRLRID